MRPSRAWIPALVSLACLSLAPMCQPLSEELKVAFPLEDQLSESGPVFLRLRLPPGADVGDLQVTLDGSTEGVTFAALADPRIVEGTLEVAEDGEHELLATLPSGAVVRRFETWSSPDSEACEMLNGAHCLLPWPSSHFLREDEGRAEGLNPLVLAIPEEGLPDVDGEPLTSTAYEINDGFSPTAQILMHFPQPVDLEASGASRLLPPPPSPVSPPYVGLRTHDGTSLESDSPTLLIHAETGERVIHFMELDARAGDPARRSLVMRPGVALEPGERYIVAVRDLVDVKGAPVEAEVPFAALRDGRRMTVERIFHRRAYFESEIFAPLEAAGVSRDDLILAFDFTVQSEQGLTAQMLSMQAQGVAYADSVAGSNFTVESVEENDCSGEEVTWRTVRGTYDVPLFLTLDPVAQPNDVGFLLTDEEGTPVPNGITKPDFTIGIPCSAQDPEAPSPSPLLLGHGLFGRGEGLVTGFASGFGGSMIAGATDWRGLSNLDLLFIGLGVLGAGESQLNNFAALPDRLRQGMLNTLVLSRMMKHGHFNSHACFQVRDPLPVDCVAAGDDPEAAGVFPGAEAEMYYFGISLGGIMGTFYAALTPDVERFNLDVPAINFSFLLQRSTQFEVYDDLLEGIGLTDPMDSIIGLGLTHELWVRGEPAGYIHRLTPAVANNEKKVMMTVAWLDKQVSNQVQEVMARTLGLSNLEGSILAGLQGIPDALGPLDSALVVQATGSFDLWNPAHEPHIPPLANQIPSRRCDPHAARLRIPAARDQLLGFLQPGGVIENFCTGVCDGAIPYEKPDGSATSCDPTL